MVINPIVGVYRAPLQGFPIKGWMTIPNTRSLDPGSHVVRLGESHPYNQPTHVISPEGMIWSPRESNPQLQQTARPFGAI